ncbi:MAG: hypothetical protein BM556_03515 [Bacteriovorax sp. MedPE-SWde]|nr:MAG: hypothetical protein BM556_03515 [Bacteriovorax sp. MedPE-SWde]
MKDTLLNEIHNDEWMMNILKLVRDLDLPDCWIGAGFVRNKAWDFLHQYSESTPLSDIDVVFLDKKNTSKEYEKELEAKLSKQASNIKWEVINQARTHLWHNKQPYNSTEQAISDWIETATCIGIRLTVDNNLILITPHGLKDIESLTLRPVPSLKDMTLFNERIHKKSWLKLWPKLSIANSDKL